MNLKNYFVSKKLATHLKNKGFKEVCFGHYKISKYEVVIEKSLYNQLKIADNWVDAPTYEQVKYWLRDHHKINIDVSPIPMYSDQYGIKVEKISIVTSGWEPLSGKTYFEAYGNAITKALQIIK
jgi:hypothetical protein